jgi:hypothetical protein
LKTRVSIWHDATPEHDAGPAVLGLGHVGPDDPALSLLTHVQVDAPIVLDGHHSDD